MGGRMHFLTVQLWGGLCGVGLQPALHGLLHTNQDTYSAEINPASQNTPSAKIQSSNKRTFLPMWEGGVLPQHVSTRKVMTQSGTQGRTHTPGLLYWIMGLLWVSPKGGLLSSCSQHFSIFAPVHEEFSPQERRKYKHRIPVSDGLLLMTFILPCEKERYWTHPSFHKKDTIQRKAISPRSAARTQSLA